MTLGGTRPGRDIARTAETKEPTDMTKPARWPTSLRTLDLFSECSRSELQRIASLITPVDLHPGDVLLTQHALDRQFLILASGEVKVTRTEGSETRDVATLGAGDFVGEIALLDQRPRSATVVALTDATVYACNAKEFFSLLEAAPSVAAKIIHAATERSRANQVAA